MAQRETPADTTLQKDTNIAVWSVPVVFVLIGIVYIVTLTALFPNMPVIAHRAENIPGYDVNYPPFRVDEFNYHTMAENILGRDIYGDGSLERGYPLGFSVIAAPFVAALGKAGGYYANALIMLAACFVFYLLVRRCTSRLKSLIMTVILALATLNWFYAASCYAEPLAQLLVLAGWFLTSSAVTGRKRKFILAGGGVLIALNLFVRPHYIVLAIIFAAFLAFREGKRRPSPGRSS